MAKVLIVDDAELVRLHLKQLLTKNMFEVVGEAEDGYMAVKKYKLLRPDIVTTDITMPGVNGIAAIEQICAFDPQARIVVISAMGQLQIVRQAIAAGAVSFIIKPYSDESVLETLNAVLEK